MQRLEGLVGKKQFRLFGYNTPEEPYNGYVLPGAFKIERNINYRNSFLPQIEGIIQPHNNGSIVRVKMQMLSFVLVFMIIWLNGALLGGIAVLTSAFMKGRFELYVLVPFGMFAFGYCLATGSFKYESGNSKAFLVELLEVYRIVH